MFPYQRVQRGLVVFVVVFYKSMSGALLALMQYSTSGPGCAHPLAHDCVEDMQTLPRTDQPRGRCQQIQLDSTGRVQAYCRWRPLITVSVSWLFCSGKTPSHHQQGVGREGVGREGAELRPRGHGVRADLDQYGGRVRGRGVGRLQGAAGQADGGSQADLAHAAHAEAEPEVMRWLRFFVCWSECEFDGFGLVTSGSVGHLSGMTSECLHTGANNASGDRNA